MSHNNITFTSSQSNNYTPPESGAAQFNLPHYHILTRNLPTPPEAGNLGVSSDYILIQNFSLYSSPHSLLYPLYINITDNNHSKLSSGSVFTFTKNCCLSCLPSPVGRLTESLTINISVPHITLAGCLF